MNQRGNGIMLKQKPMAVYSFISFFFSFANGEDQKDNKCTMIWQMSFRKVHIMQENMNWNGISSKADEKKNKLPKRLEGKTNERKQTDGHGSHWNIFHFSTIILFRSLCYWKTIEKNPLNVERVVYDCKDISSYWNTEMLYDLKIYY